MRAGHAIAKDAVYADISQEFVDSLKCLQLHSQNTDREDYLLYPNKGRRLNDESLALLSAEGSHDKDVQVIIADGLSAWAAERNVPELLSVLMKELSASGLTHGEPLFARFARVGIQDHVGVTLNAKSTVYCSASGPVLVLAIHSLPTLPLVRSLIRTTPRKTAFQISDSLDLNLPKLPLKSCKC